MFQIAAMSTAKPAAPKGMDALAGVTGDGPISTQFGAFLETRLEGTAIQADGSDAQLALATKGLPRQAGKTSGKILPAALPDGGNLPQAEAGELASLQPADKAEDLTKAEDRTAVPSFDPISPILVPIAPDVQQGVAAAPVSIAGNPLPGPASSHRPAKSLEVRVAQPSVVPQEAAPQLSSTVQGEPAAAAPQPGTDASKLAPSPGLRTTITATTEPLPQSAQVIRLSPAVTGPALPAQAASPAVEATVAAVRTAVPAAKGRNAGQLVENTDANAPAALPGAGFDEPRPARPVSAAAGTNGHELSGWFSQGPATQPADHASASREGGPAAAGGPQDFAALVDRLVEAREAAMPAAVHAAIRHAEFGNVTMKFEQDDAGLNVALSSPDPDFARAVQAAAPAERQGAAGDAPSQGSSGMRHETHANSGNGAEPQARKGSGGEQQSADSRVRHSPAARRKSEERNTSRDGIFA